MFENVLNPLLQFRVLANLIVILVVVAKHSVHKPWKESGNPLELSVLILIRIYSTWVQPLHLTIFPQFCIITLTSFRKLMSHWKWKWKYNLTWLFLLEMFPAVVISHMSRKYIKTRNNMQTTQWPQYKTVLFSGWGSRFILHGIVIILFSTCASKTQ